MMNKIESLAYNMWLTFLPLIEQPTGNLSNTSLKPSIYKLNKIGDKILPCGTPFVTVKEESDMQFAHRTE